MTVKADFDHGSGNLEPVVGFEPTTDGLQNRCSTTELNWLGKEPALFQLQGFDFAL
jgi:hypothetical protein